ncbi:MAG TPA: hypothetical protein VMH26_00280 [Burkholderiales bacterium]|nr:hypothetical protein [Burkholderiales bacterium]
MYTRIASALVAVVLAGCAGKGSTPNAREVPLTKEQLVANHTNTIVTYQLSDGGSGQNVFDSDGGVRGTYNGKTGPQKDSGRYAWEKGNVDCIFWNSGGKSCWAEYKVGDNKYVAHEQGGKKRTAEYSVQPIE